METTLLIHIGWHKTATSAIQLYFNGHREKLRELGVCYPVIDDRIPSRRIRHSYLFHSIRHRLQLDDVPLTEQVRDFDEVIASSAGDMTGSGCPFSIISDEGLSMPDQRIARLMTRFRDHFDTIKIVAYLRRQDYFLESFYAQLVKVKPHRISVPFAEFIRDPRMLERINYETILGWWADAFGRENILVAPFEGNSMGPDPVTCFFRLAGLPESILGQLPPEKKETHVTPPREVTEYFRHLNCNNVDFFIGTLAEYLRESGTAVTDARYLGLADRQLILREYERSNQAVARKYLGRDNGVLFAEPVREYENCPATWQGLDRLELLDFALPATGKMSVDIAMLRRKLSELEAENSALKTEYRELRDVKQQTSSLKETLCRFSRNLKQLAGNISKRK